MSSQPENGEERPFVAVIGGGPAGLMAADRLSAAGCRVTVYEHMPSVGRKLLMAGRGGLNLTHGEDLHRFLARYDPGGEALLRAIKAFPPEALRAWADGLDAETFVGSSGRVFPRAMKASPLLRAWLARLDRQGVRVLTRHRWLGWHEDGALLFREANGQLISVRAAATLLALGGASWPRLGADGAWTEILAARGVPIAQLAPSNMGFDIAWSERFRDRFAGQPLKPVRLSHDGASVRGEAMITRYGIEGGAVYALSSRLRTTIERKGRALLTADLRPDLDAERIADRLVRRRRGESRSNAFRKAVGLTPLAIGILHEATAGAVPTDPVALAALVKAVPLALTGVQPIARAISSAGGIRFDAVDEHFMLKALPGTFVAGEMLDWDAPTGGYLLQGAFATAVAAATGIAVWLGSEMHAR
ncbi:NAD(P)/FAD-dependent oxidoreductase [Rhodoligotrophos defluvii]|uniref:NAD(P)/FAD-dependent oxidoreductase n=1 Tax=Rhodoligotrophos defluvii TaxID=2561934 RepID=UPI0010C9CF18|nr:TIGR03862 family flavoprotein [Rhodoligotrophos defluvii]